MKSNSGRLLYDALFLGSVAALAWFNRDLYDKTESMIAPVLQAYTAVGMFLIGLALLLFVFYLREAIAATFVNLTSRADGSSSGMDAGRGPAHLAKSARRMMRKGEFQSAGEAYESVEMYREAAMAYERGNIFTRAAQAWAQAEAYPRAIELYEKDQNYEAAGDLCLLEGLAERAKRNYRLAGELCQSQNQLVPAAGFYEKAEDFEKAALVYEQAHKQDRALASYEKMGNSSKILEILKSMPPTDYLRRGNEFTQLVERCAEKLYQDGFAEDAAKILEETHSYTRAAEVYAATKMWEKAAELYITNEKPEMAESLIPKIPDPVIAADFRARLAAHRGDWQAAGKHFEEAGKATQAVDAYKKAKDFASAARLYENMGRFILAGEMYSSARDNLGAANAYAKAYDWRNAAECFEACGDTAQAIEAYANAANYLKAGKLALQLTDYARAVEYLQRIPAAAPDFQAGTAFLATAFYYQSMYDMASELFSRSMKNLPVIRPNLPAYYAYARSLEREDPKESLSLFRQILGVDVRYSDVSDRVQHLEKIITSMSLNASNGNSTPAIVQQQRPAFTPPVEQGMPVGSMATPLRNNLSAGSTKVITPPGDLHPPAPTHSGFTAGDLLGGRYELQSSTTRQARMVDHEATDTVSGQPVVVRTFAKPADSQVLSETKDLIEKAMRLEHPALVPLIAWGESDGDIYCVSARPSGESLRQYVRTRGPLSVNAARQVLTQVLQGLDYAHSQEVCHLNLRPEMLYKISGEGGSDAPAENFALSGFGVPLRQPENTEPVYATLPDLDPQYLAPEQIIGSDVDARTDIYAFGLLLFFVLTGRTPFEVKRVQDTQEIARMQVQASLTRPSTIRATLPSMVDDVFLKCVYKSPLSRYQSISELLEDFRQISLTPIA